MRHRFTTGPRSGRCLAALAALALSAASAGPARAGEIGQIAFTRGGDVWTADADGTDPRRLTSGPANDRWPRWSPEGARLAIVREGDLILLLTDGTLLRTLTTHGDVAGAPSWSPNGRYLVYARGSGGIAVVESTQAGSDGTLLDVGPAVAVAWNPLVPDQIAYTDGAAVLSVRPDGAEAGVEIVPPDPDGRTRTELAWDSERGQIVFSSTGADGTRIEGAGVSVDAAAGDDHSPSWSPDGQMLFERAGVLHVHRPIPFADDRNVRSLGIPGEAPDGQPVLVSSVAAFETNVGTQLVFQVRPLAGETTSLSYQTIAGAGSATEVADYWPTLGTVSTREAFGHPALVPVLVFGDSDPEPDETFVVEFAFPADAAAPLHVRGTILNDDGGRNGLITYSGEGPVFALDPVHGWAQPLVAEGGAAVFEPAGHRLAHLRQTATGDIELVVADTDGLPQVVFPLAGPIDDEIAWSPDGARLAWTVGTTLWVADPNHASSAAAVATDAVTPSWSADPAPGPRRLAFRKVGTGMACTIRDDGTGESCPTAGLLPQWSPDNATIAYIRDDTFVFLRNADGTGERLVATGPGVSGAARRLRWSPRGTSFAFLTDDALFVGQEGAAATRVVGLPSALWGFDWSPDGQQLVVQGTSPDGSFQLWIAGPDDAGQRFARVRQVTSSLTHARAEQPRWSAAAARPTVAPPQSRGGIEQFQQARVEVELDAPATETVTLTWETIDTGSAAPDVDYTSVAGATIVLAPGETRAALPIPLIDDAETEGPESFDVALTLASGARLTADRQVTVFITDDDIVNQPPVAVNDLVSTALDTAVDVDVLANDTDADGDALTVTGVSTPAHGTATLSGGIVTYTPDAGFNGVDHFIYAIADGAGGHTAQGAVSVYVGQSAPPPPVLTVTPGFLDFGPVPLGKTKDLVVTVTNQTAAPVALAEYFFVEQGEPRPFDATSIDGCRLPWFRVLEPGASCTQTVRFWAVAGAGDASPAAARLLDGNTFETLAVLPLFASTGPPDTGPNAPPVAVDDLAGLAPGFTHTLDATRNDSDPDHDVLQIVSVSDPPHGTASVVGCDVFGLPEHADCIRYVADAGYAGMDAVAYTVSDGRGGTASATFHLVVGTVVPRVDAIVPSRGPITGGQTVRITGAGFVFRSDVAFVCGGSLQPLQVLSLTDTEIVALTPAAPPGVCALRVRTLFGQEGQRAGAYTYGGFGAPPVAQDQSAATNQDAAVVLTLGATDPEGDALTLSIVTAPQHGTLSAINGNQVTYTPAASYTGPDAFTFKANDGGADSNPATVSLVVHPLIVTIDVSETIQVTDDVTVQPALLIEVAETIQVSDAVSVKMSPAAQNGTASIAEDTFGLVSLVAAEGDGDPFTVTVVSGPAHGTVWPPPGTVMPSGTLVTYTPAPNYFGPDAFTFKATDVQGDSNLATVTVTVTPIPDPPGAAPDGPYVVNAGATLTVPPPGVLLNDAELDLEPLTARLVTPPAHGTLTLRGDGGFTYTPDPHYFGADAFTYVAHDGLYDSSPATAVLQVNPAAGREVRTGIVAPGDSLTTDTEGDGATPEDVIETTVLTPQGGEVVIDEQPVPAPPPTAFVFLPVQVAIAAPPAVTSQPLLLTFLIDGSMVPSADATTLGTLAVFRNGVEVPPCGPGSSATPNPCVASREVLDGDARITVQTSHDGLWTFGVPRSTSGLATGALRLRPTGRVAFAVGKVNGQLVGTLSYQKGPERFLAVHLTAFAVEANGRTAWFAGHGTDGRTFLACAQDRGPRRDRFRLWIGGVEKTSGGRPIAGDLVVVR